MGAPGATGAWAFGMELGASVADGVSLEDGQRFDMWRKLCEQKGKKERKRCAGNSKYLSVAKEQSPGDDQKGPDCGGLKMPGI